MPVSVHRWAVIETALAGFPDISHHCHFAPLSPEDASPSHLNETSRIIVISHHSHLNETSRIIVISHHSHHLKTIQDTIILYNYSLCRPTVGICIVTKANGGYMHYSNVNKTCKNVYNVYTFQIHITQFIITYVLGQHVRDQCSFIVGPPSATLAQH